METDDDRRVENQRVLLDFFRYLSDRNYDAGLELLGDEVLWEMPFAPPSLASYDRARFAKLLHGWPGFFSEGITFHEVTIHPMVDPDRFVVEFRSEAIVAATGKPYRNHYVGFFRLSEGRIVRVREFFDSRVAIQTFSWRYE